MKTITFSYTKQNGLTSNRTVLVMAEPTDKYAGIDISELNEEAQGIYIAAVAEATMKYKDALKSLEDSFDLNNRYRQFIPSKMANITQETI